MKVLELFAGTRSIGKAFEARGHEVYSIEWDTSFPEISLYADVLSVTAEDIIARFGHPDIIWASPDCTTFSIAAISHHRRRNKNTGNLDPKFKPMCKNGDPCHARAPRGAKTGTQGLKHKKDRSRIPAELCKHIVDICEEEYYEVDILY